MALEFLSRSEDQSEALAAATARLLKPGDIVLLKGQLGAGKTFFIRAAAHALGIREPVTSPSFIIARTYTAGDIRVHHLDLYRLSSFNLQDEIDLEHFLEEDALTFIEWPEQAESFIGEPSVTIHISHVDERSRKFELDTASAAVTSGLERFIAEAGS
jgi:tRNA threonylcarbamoyladenosine biosynthesis protein TsaE